MKFVESFFSLILDTTRTAQRVACADGTKILQTNIITYENTLHVNMRHKEFLWVNECSTLVDKRYKRKQRVPAMDVVAYSPTAPNSSPS